MLHLSWLLVHGLSAWAAALVAAALCGPLFVAFRRARRAKEGLADTPRRALARAAVVSAGSFVAISALLGEIGLQAIQRAVRNEMATRTGTMRDDELRSEALYVALAIAAASPLQRGRALDAATTVVSWRCGHDYSRDQVELVAWTWQRGGRCAPAALDFLYHHLPERAASIAGACGDQRVLGLAERARGRFAEAADAFAAGKPFDWAHDELVNVEVLLLADRNAGEATRRAADLSKGQGSGENEKVLRCLAGAVDPHPGLGVRPLFEASAGAPVDCMLLEADRLQGEQRSKVLAGLTPATLARAPRKLSRDGFEDDRGPLRQEIAGLLAVEPEHELNCVRPERPRVPLSCPPRAQEDPVLLDHPSDLFFQPRLGAPGLSRRVLSAMEPSLAPGAFPCARLMQVAVPVAAFEALTGDGTKALRVARLALDNAPPEDRARASAFLAAIELYAGDPEKARAMIASLPPDVRDRAELAWLAGLATATPAPPFTDRLDSYGRMEMTAWFEGDNRDGARLARLVQRRPQHLGLVRLAARKIERGQGELLEWLRWGDKGWIDRPASFAITTARLRDLASTLGEPALVREHEATARAFHEGLARRDLAVPLAVLSLQ